MGALAGGALGTPVGVVMPLGWDFMDIGVDVRSGGVAPSKADTDGRVGAAVGVMPLYCCASVFTGGLCW